MTYSYSSVFRINTLTLARSQFCLKGLFTPSESGSESEKDQRINDKHQRNFSLPLPLYLGVNWPLRFVHTVRLRLRQRSHYQIDSNPILCGSGSGKVTYNVMQNILPQVHRMGLEPIYLRQNCRSRCHSCCHKCSYEQLH